MKFGRFLQLVAMLMAAESAFSSVITSVESGTINNQSYIDVGFSGELPATTTFNLSSPPRIIVDMEGVTASMVDRKLTTESPLIPNFELISSAHEARLVGKLKHPASLTEQRLENSIRFFFSKSTPEEVNRHATSPTATPDALSVSNLSFHRYGENNGKILLSFNRYPDALSVSEASSIDGSYQLTIPGVQVQEGIAGGFDVSDFGTVVDQIHLKSNADNTVINVVPAVDASLTHDWSLDGKELILLLTQKKSFDEVDYVGERVSMNLQDVEVRDALQILADQKQLNLVASDQVTQRISIRLDDVPWDQAMDTILTTTGLDKRLVNNVLMIAPTESLADLERSKLKAAEDLADLMPLHTTVIELKYANAQEVAAMLESGDEEGVLSSRGSISIVKQLNALMLKDTAASIRDVKELISLIDKPVKQVFIEARLVAIDSNRKDELGVAWSGGRYHLGGSDQILVGGRGSNFNYKEGDTVLSGDQFNRQGKTSFTGKNPFLDFGVKGAGSSGLALAFANDNLMLNLEISALISDGGGSIISEPTVITTNNTEARILKGKKIPYEKTEGNGSKSVEFQEAVLSLAVTPQIIPDDKLLLKVVITNNDTTTTTKTGVPIIDANELVSNILIEDGSTVVLGGIRRTAETSGQQKVPLLGDIPGVGRLFRQDKESFESQELLILITPRIVDDEAMKAMAAARYR
ncbi:type IV pilus secretin PilQ [Endozoicomonas gorgoniicola]|uniref:Type IV pilus secretin PilQ n=1 Tax=Endozoicomonas gorgoniicola TaxID=1234144 RepID=A0ABT3MXW4_9GAMM|nr:type IV pilus secretin PilQ [Endozoicomonas gorgoniicola]MCW7554224.1 type IV pilus secretin PilQ [Endozoicomonas gorgoniicola]